MRGAPDWDDVFMGAALEPQRWPDALDLMACHTGSSHGQLIGVGGAREIPFNIVTQFDESKFQEFIDIGGASPVINFRVAAAAESISRGDYDAILSEADYDSAAPRLTSRRYVEWCEEMDIPYGCQTNLVVDRVGLVGFAILRKRREGRTSMAQRRHFARMSQAARRAVRLQERLEGNQARLLAGAFEAMSAAAFVLDSMGRVQALTENAEQIVASGDIALRGGVLDAPGTPFSLAAGVAALIADGGMDHVRLRIDCASGQPHFLEGFRLPERAWSLGHLPHAILIARAPQRDRAGIAAFLAALYRLTAAEADIAMRLFEGNTRAEICTARAVTLETLRGQIKSACAKAGAGTEADLMRLMAAIMA